MAPGLKYPPAGEQGHQDRHPRDPASEYQGGDGQRPQNHPDWGKPLPKGKKQPSPQSGRSRQREDEEANKRYGGSADSRPRLAQPGPGAPTGGTGKDSDSGKERTTFENQRRRQNQGGSDRPGIYKPKDDGQRGGYVGRSKKKIIAKPGASNATKLAVTRINTVRI